MKNAGLRGRISVNNFNSQGAIVLLLLSPVLFNGRPSLLCSPSEWTCFARLRFQEEKFSAPIKRNTHRSLPAQSDSSPSIHSNSSSSYSYSLDNHERPNSNRRKEKAIQYVYTTPNDSRALFLRRPILRSFGFPPLHTLSIPLPRPCLACFLFLAVCILSCLLAVFGTPAFSRRYILC